MSKKESKINPEGMVLKMKKDTYITLLGFRDVCYNDFDFEVDVKNPYLGVDGYKKIEEILKKHEDEDLLTQFEEGSHIYQDYSPEYLSLTTKHEIQHDINAARKYLDDYSGSKDDRESSYKAFLDDNSLSYSFSPKDNLSTVQNDLNDIDTEKVIVWQRRDDEYILLPHSINSLERIKKQIMSAKRIEDKELRSAMEKLFNNLNEFLMPFSESQFGKYDKKLPDELKDKLEHEALTLQNVARDEAAKELAEFALATAKKFNNDEF